MTLRNQELDMLTLYYLRMLSSSRLMKELPYYCPNKRVDVEIFFFEKRN